MDGSNYRHQREEPPDHDVEIGINRSFILVVILSALVAGGFFFIHREQALELVGCLTGTGQSCGATAAQAPSTASQAQ